MHRSGDADRLRRDHDFNVCDARLCQPLAQTADDLRIGVYGVDSATRADCRSEPNREKAVARSHVCDRGARTHACGCEQIRNALPRLSCLFGLRVDLCAR